MDKDLYKDVRINSARHYEPLFGPNGLMAKADGPSEHVKTLHVHWIPRGKASRQMYGMNVDEFHHDMGLIGKEFMTSDLGTALERRIGVLATLCIPLWVLSPLLPTTLNG